MRLIDSDAREITVERDPVHAGVAMQIGDIDADGSRIVHLTREEARRLAALILFQTARLERPGASWRVPTSADERLAGIDAPCPVEVRDVSH